VIRGIEKFSDTVDMLKLFQVEVEEGMVVGWMRMGRRKKDHPVEWV